jgi:hypothetical protein
MVIGLDPDAPFPSFNVLSPVLLWLRPCLQPQSADSSTVNLLVHDTPCIVDYAGPGPLLGGAVHRYVFLLYEQPVHFDAKERALTTGKSMAPFGRMRYDLDAFEKKIGLGSVLAANYFYNN